MKIPHSIYVALAFAAAIFFSFSGVALAAEAVDPADGSADVARGVYDAVTGGHLAYAAALALVGAVALARKWGGGRWKWMHTDAGSAGMVLAGAYGTALVAALSGGGALTPHVAWATFCVAVGTAGGYNLVKKLVVEPILMPLAARAPAAIRPILMMVIFWFEHASDQAPATPSSPSGNTAPAASAT